MLAARKWAKVTRAAKLAGKRPVLALVERGGNVRSFPIERATLKNIKPIIEKHVDPSSHLVTDENPDFWLQNEEASS